MSQLITLLKAVTADDFSKVALALVAIVSLVVSPIVQWRIARRQALLQEEIGNRQLKMQEQIAVRQTELQAAIAKRQAADNVSSKRQVWIDELRQDVAEFLTLSARLNELRRPVQGLSIEDQRLNFEEFAAANKRGFELGIRIKLRLNPKEADHNEFVRLLEVLANASPDPLANETPEQRKAMERAFAAARDAVVAQLQTILKHEWERVKKGEV